MRYRAFSTSLVAYFSAVSKNSNIEFLFSPVVRLRISMQIHILF